MNEKHRINLIDKYRYCLRNMSPYQRHTHVDTHTHMFGHEFPDFFVQAYKIAVDNSLCYCYTSYEMTD